MSEQTSGVDMVKTELTCIWQEFGFITTTTIYNYKTIRANVQWQSHDNNNLPKYVGSAGAMITLNLN